MSLRIFVLNNALTLLSAPAFAAEPIHNPLPGAPCVVTSDVDLLGEAIAIDDKVSPDAPNTHLKIVPASVFVADGYAIKLYTGKTFTGRGAIYGDQLDLARGGIPAVEGGHFFTLSDRQISDAFQSAVCVKSGELFEGATASDKAGTLFHNVAFFAGRVFSLASCANHKYEHEAQVVLEGQRKLLKLHAQSPYGSGSDSSLDLDSGAVSITTRCCGTQQTVTAAPATAKSPGLDLAYAGALSIIRNELSAIAANEPSGACWFHPPSNLELLPLLQNIDAAIPAL